MPSIKTSVDEVGTLPEDQLLPVSQSVVAPTQRARVVVSDRPAMVSSLSASLTLAYSKASQLAERAMLDMRTSSIKPSQYTPSVSYHPIWNP